MTESGETFVTRAQIAVLSGVRRPAVSNWERRYPDFPNPAQRDGDTERFRAADVAEWLSGRRIPKNALTADELPGTTYGDRFCRSLGASARSTDEAVQAELRRRLWRAMDVVRGALPLAESIETVLTVLYLLSTWPEVATAVPDALPDMLRRMWARKPTQSGTFVLSRLDALTSRPDLLGSLVQIVEAAMRSGEGAVEKPMAASAYSWLAASAGVDGTETTPPSVVELMTQMLVGDGVGEIADPFCRAGEFLTSAAMYAAPARIRAAGWAPSARALGLAAMNLDMHEVEHDLTLSPGPNVVDHAAWLRRFDVVLTNPPFNLRISDFPGSMTGMLPYGPQSPGNANFLWLESCLSMLRPGGHAGVLMSNNAGFSQRRRDQKIRAAMIENGAVECLVALPSQLFRHTRIPVTLWILREPAGKCTEILFIDARLRGAMASRSQRVLRPEDHEKIRGTYDAWRAGDSAAANLEGFSRRVPIDEVRANDYRLVPPSYVAPPSRITNPSDDLAEVARLTGDLTSVRQELARVTAESDRVLNGLLS